MNTLKPKIEVDPAAWEEAIRRLKSGELDRPQTAALLGMNLSTFTTRLRRAGLLAQLKDVRRSAGKFHPMYQADPDKVNAYEQAVKECLASKRPARSIWLAKYAERIDYVQLCAKIRQARKAPVSIALNDRA